MNYDKIYGATERHDGLTKIGRNRWSAQYGYGQDENGQGYHWSKQYEGEKPSLQAIMADIRADISERTSEAILSGHTYEGAMVWLSPENQRNYSLAYSVARHSEGKSLPVTFKLGTDEAPIYKTFETLEELEAFLQGCYDHVQGLLAAAWKEADEIDWTLFDTED